MRDFWQILAPIINKYGDKKTDNFSRNNRLRKTEMRFL